MEQTAYTYVSTRAAYDPAKTIIVCPPSGQAATLENAALFAQTSGWQTLAEYDGSVLVVPVAPNGWKAESTELPGRLYDELRGSFSSRCGNSLFGREGKIWCWETLIYLVGYGDGADFAGQCAVAEPNRFAAVALIGGAPRDFSAGENPSSHWLVRNVSASYSKKNNQIPSCVWLLDAPADAEDKAVEYFTAIGPAQHSETVFLEGVRTERRYGDAEAAGEVLISHGGFSYDICLAQAVLNGLFDRVIRWKNGPDGTLAHHPGRVGYYTSGRFAVDSVWVGALQYAYGVHIPEGMTREQVAGLPLVFSVHGRGEPAWLFATKNGWDKLADESREFVLVVPDSPGNIWRLERDGEAFGAMIDKICSDYALDKSRVYLTGFSNGAAITREVGTSWPQLFAGLSPWNGPVNVRGVIQHHAVMPEFLQEGYDMPYWVCVGDNDPAAGLDVDGQLEPMLEANGCAKRPAEGMTSRFAPDEVRTGENWYTPEKGYKQGERFTTMVYHGVDGSPRVGYTVMRDMPHGAIAEQSKACWEFLRAFRRPDGAKQVVWEPDHREG